MTVVLGALVPAAGFADASSVADIARHCEDAGLESIWLAEHAALPVTTDAVYPYAADGRLPIPSDTAMPDPLVWFAAAAAATRSLHFGTAYLGATPRNPFVLAKQTATLERLAPGRIELGVGVGWCTEELVAAGVEPGTASDRFEEVLTVLRSLWSGRTDHDGTHWSFADMQCEPRPTGPLPLLVEASNPLEAARAGVLGDGLLARHVDPGSSRRLIDEMRSAAEDAGRSAAALSVTMVVTPAPGLRDELAGLGVDRAVALLPPMDPERFTRVVAALAGRWTR
jgi:probable F420-dependent oxidoreductase